MIGVLKREDGTSIGVMQLCNCKNPIQKHDINKYEAVCKFLGSCVENVENLTKKLTTTIGAEFGRTKQAKVIEDSIEAVAGDHGTKKAYSNIQKPLDVMDSSLANNWNVANYPKL